MSVRLSGLLRGTEKSYYWFLVLLFLLGFLPLGTVAGAYSIFYLRFTTELLVLGLFALSVDIIMGYTGLVSLGPAAFFGVGAYAGGLTLLNLANSIWLALLVALVLSGVAAWVIGYLSIRIRGVYFAMLTLAFAEMFHELAFNWQSLTGGSDGLAGVPRPDIGIGPFVLSLADPYVCFYFVLTVVILIYYGCVRLVNSPFGRILQAIRDNEERIEFIGYDVRAFKRRSFVISGMIGGVSGCLFALVRFVDPGILHWFTSAEALVMNLFGGMGTLYGPIIGAFAFLFARDLISSYTEHWRIILGIVFVAFVLYSPQGIVGLSRAVMERVVPIIIRLIRTILGGTRRESALSGVGESGLYPEKQSFSKQEQEKTDDGT